MKKLLILLLMSLLAVSVVSAQTTYKDGDAYIGEDVDDPNWIWDFVNLWSTLPKIGIENDFVWNDDSDNPAGVGQCFSLPYNYVQVCLDGLTNSDTAYPIYTFGFDGDTDLSEAHNGDLISVPAFLFSTNKANGFKIGSVTAAKLWLHLNGTVVTLYYENSNGKTVKSGVLNSGSILGYIGNNEMIFSESGGYYQVTLQSKITNSIGEKIILKLGPKYGLFDSLGSIKSTAEQDELVWERSGMTPLQIGTKDEDHRSMYGTLIRNPKLHGASDEVELAIPDEQVKAKINIKGTSPSSISGGITKDVPLGVSLVDGGFSNYLSSADLPSLIDNSIVFNSETIDVHDSLELFNGGPTVETSLTSNEDDYQAEVVLEVQGPDRIKYYYYFDEYIDLKKVSSSMPLNIKFLGQDLKITSVPENAKIVVGGEITKTCTDSDGGENYYVKGSTTLSDGSGLNDDCRKDYVGSVLTLTGELLEAVCLSDGSDDKYITYKCPYGCKDGACIQQTSTCTDSDGGKNFYVKGYVSTNYNGQDPNNKVYDSCMLPDPNNPGQSYGVASCSGESCSVEDFYCEGQQGPYGAFSKCPNGCKDGACIQIVSCNNNSVCDYEESFMYVGNSATYKGSTIKLENVGSQGGVVVDVNGVKETLVALIPEVVNGIPIKVKTALYNPSKEGRSATLVFGENSYLCGDCWNNPECFDSDNGQSFYELGTVIERTQYSKWEPNIFSDMCSTDSPQGNLAEAICKKSSDGYYYGSQVFFECPLGCKDGVCLTNETTCASAADNCCLPGDDMVCDPDCSTGEDPDCVECTSKAGDCCLSESDGICDTDCQTGEDPDCKEIGCNYNGVCELSRKENSGNCPEDCYCGDGICDPVEKPKKCQEDCGYCTPEWECHLEPATCPEEGIQNKVCIDTKCGSEDSRIEALKCLSGTCSGCLSEGTCYPVTTRMLLGEIPNYCDVTKTFANQKDLGAPCQNNYECLSNECSDGECISIKKQLEETQSLLKKILEWLKNIF